MLKNNDDEAPLNKYYKLCDLLETVSVCVCFFFSVCSPFERATIAGINLVRGSARFPEEKYVSASAGNRSHWHSISILLDRLHSRPALRHRTNDAKTVH